MRLALRNTLMLLAGYGAVLLVVAGFIVYQLLVLEARVQKDASRLFASEVAQAITEPSLDRLLHADREARRNLKTLIEQLTKNSQLVTSITVVDRLGHVVASDTRPMGAKVSTPDQIFGASQRMVFITFGTLPFSSGSYELVVPLMQRGERVGYLDIRMKSQRLAEVNERMWTGLFLAAMIGLVCIVGLGFALHVQLAQRSRTLTHALEAALRGESPQADPELDEFSQALETASRAGAEIGRARARSAQERGRFVALGQRLNVGVLLLKADGQLEFASRRACELFACADEQELGGLFQTLRGEIDQGLGRLPQVGPEGVWIDLEVPGRRGGLRLRLEFYALEQQGDGVQLVLVRDRASMQAMEKDLRLASQLRGLARLYLSVAHDIRAPLAAIVTHLDLLGGSLENNGAAASPDAQERRRVYVGVLQQELQRLRRSLDGLLNHATVPRDDLAEFDVRDVVRDFEHLLGPQCARQNVSFSVQVPDRPAPVVGVRDALKQALVNLGINALEAMPGGGRLDIRLDSRDSKTSISVADSGPGVAPEARDKIFGMHYTTKPDGTGIGLYVARAVAESLGGEIRVESEPGQGATFRIELPAVVQEV